MGTKFEVTNAGLVKFNQNGTEELVLEKGTTPPVSSIEGQIFYKTDTQALLVSDGASFNVLGTATGSGWSTSGSDVILTISTNNVGIGTNTPTHKLDVFKPSGATYLEVASGSGSILDIIANGNTDVQIGTASNHRLTLYTNNSGTPSLYLDTSNRVGIGTAPTQRLHVYGASGNQTIQLESGSGGQLGINTNTDGSIGMFSNHSFTLYTNNIDRVTIKNTGEVGISNTSPSVALDVTGAIKASTSIDINGPLTVANGSAAAPTLSFRTDTDNGFYLETTNRIGITTAGVQCGKIDANGRFGMFGTSGMAAPSSSSRIHVRDGALISDQTPYSDFNVNKLTMILSGGGVLNADPKSGHNFFSRTLFQSSSGTGPFDIVSLTNAGSSGVNVAYVWMAGKANTTNKWADFLVCSSINASPTVISSYTVSGSPASRTYSVSSGVLRVTFGASTGPNIYVDTLAMLMQISN